jgi:hypothetical protein
MYEELITGEIEAIVSTPNDGRSKRGKCVRIWKPRETGEFNPEKPLFPTGRFWIGARDLNILIYAYADPIREVFPGPKHPRFQRIDFDDSSAERKQKFSLKDINEKHKKSKEEEKEDKNTIKVFVGKDGKSIGIDPAMISKRKNK